MEDKTLPAPPMRGEPLTQLEKKAVRDKDRKRKGKSHKKRVPLLLHPKIKAFLGWKTEQEPWTYETVNKYVDWCHINKLFPYWRHKIHLAQNKANLGYCKNESFTKRCLIVWMRLYGDSKPCRNDNFCFFLVQMVYAECILKKKVDWTTVKELLVGERVEEEFIVAKDATIDVKQSLAPVKPGKLALADEEVVWSPNSASDEHTHEYDGYNFSSDNEDMDIGEQKRPLEVEHVRKGKRKDEELEIPPNTLEYGRLGKEPMEVDNIVVQEDQNQSEDDADEDVEVLMAKIESASLALEVEKEEVKKLRDLQAQKLSSSTNATVVYGLKEELRAINKAISQNDERLVALRKSKDHYCQKKKRTRCT